MVTQKILDDFIGESVSPSEKGILALTILGAIIGILGIFWTLLIPAAVVEDIVVEATEFGEEIGVAIGESAATDAESLATVAINRVGEGLSSPKAAPGQGAAIYGSIPGALITGSASVWSKVVANDA